MQQQLQAVFLPIPMPRPDSREQESRGLKLRGEQERCWSPKCGAWHVAVSCPTFGHPGSLPLPSGMRQRFQLEDSGVLHGDSLGSSISARKEAQQRCYQPEISLVPPPAPEHGGDFSSAASLTATDAVPAQLVFISRGFGDRQVPHSPLPLIMPRFIPHAIRATAAN